MGNGTVYTETVVWSAPEQFTKDAPYQIAIITFEDGKRVTARIEGGRVAIGDLVRLVELRNDIPFYEKV
jgi:uncharacterized OB-fold protein